MKFIVAVLFLLVTHSAPPTYSATIPFGLIFPTIVDYPAPIPSNTEIGWGTFLIANLGAQDFRPRELSLTGQVTSTTQLAPFSISIFNYYSPGFVLHPGEAAGAIGNWGGGPATIDLSYVQSFFPTVTTLISSSTLEVQFPNQTPHTPFGNSETLLTFSFGKGPLDTFTTTVLTHDPQIGNNSLIHAGAARFSFLSPVPASSTLLLFGSGLMLFVALSSHQLSRSR